jgi:hypothetical protein
MSIISSHAHSLSESSAIIYNYIIQNEIDIEDSHELFSGKSIGFNPKSYYTTLLHDFDISLKHEIDITNETSKFISDKIGEYDFRKVNISQLVSDLTSKLKERMLSVTKGERIRCTSYHPELTINNEYTVSLKDNLMVVVENDNGDKGEYNYRLFESIMKLRNNALDILLGNG